MVVSQHVSETTLKKAMSLLLFLKLMHDRDDDTNDQISSDTNATVLAEKAASLLSTSKTFVYECYKEWCDGQEHHSIKAEEEKNKFNGAGWFLQDNRGSYERRFLLDEQDLKIKFKTWMRLNLRTLTVDSAWEFINSKLLKKVPQETLLAHRISLPIARSTAYEWMLKCNGSRTDSEKTYYNDYHQHSEVIEQRTTYTEK